MLSSLRGWDISNSLTWTGLKPPLNVERLDFFFTANNVVEDPQNRVVLCNVGGPATYAIIRVLCAPATPVNTLYADIVSKLTAHLTPRPSVIVQCFAFYKRSQQPGETIADLIAALRRLSEHCILGETLSDMLRDRLVCGVRGERVQRRLLAEPTLERRRWFGKERWQGTYSLPISEQLLARLGGCSVFSRLELEQAYQQLMVNSTGRSGALSKICEGGKIPLRGTGSESTS